MAQPESASNWRLKAGIAVLVLALALPLSALLVPLLDLPVAQSALVAGGLVAGAPEVLMLLAVALLGRQNFDRIIGAAKKFFLATFFASPVSRGRYYAGLAVCVLSIVPLYLAGYLPSWMPAGNNRIIILAAGDVAFILSIFVMGGEFWEKFRRLFVWEGRV